MTAGHEGTRALSYFLGDTFLPRWNKILLRSLLCRACCNFLCWILITVIYTVPNEYRASLWEAAKHNPQPREKQEYWLDLSEAQKHRVVFDPTLREPKRDTSIWVRKSDKQLHLCISQHGQAMALPWDKDIHYSCLNHWLAAPTKGSSASDSGWSICLFLNFNPVADTKKAHKVSAIPR